MKKESTQIKPIQKLEGEIFLPGDKSISHRAVMLGAISEGVTTISNFLMAQDCMATIGAFQKMGVKIELNNTVKVHGVGLKGLKRPKGKLYLGNSGTSMRLLMGILAGQDFQATLTGDESLSKRPMNRVSEPLKKMGAAITGRAGGNFAPIKIKGGELKSIDFRSKISSAQVKSAILLAALYAKGVTFVTEPTRSRDHTERMLKLLGADVKVNGLKISISSKSKLKARDIIVPGDISSAAFFIVGAMIMDESSLVIRNVGFNGTRTGAIDILRRMGGKIKIDYIDKTGEPIADIIVSSSSLKAVTVNKKEVPRAIDELPIIMVAASFAKGRTVIKGAGELRVKETDRIRSMINNLRTMGVDISSRGDDIFIEGALKRRGGEFLSYGDHRTAMSMAIAALKAQGPSVINDTACVSTSFPGFFEILKSVSVGE